MTGKARFVFSDALLAYHFHEEHPFNQERILFTKTLLESEGLLDEEDIIAPRKATDEEIALFHDDSYVEAVKQAGKGLLSKAQAESFGIGTEDTPIFRNMHEAASSIVGGTLTAVDAVLNGDAVHALNLAGGLHHAFEREASGFCVYNDAAIAIKYIRKKYGYKVLYVDTDAHHGDGVQSAFYDDCNVCTFSIHETGRYLFPGTGNVNERGIKEGYGYSFNLPIDAFTEDESFIDIYDAALTAIVDYFQPDVILTQNGADAHFCDPLTHLSVSMRTFEKIPLLAHELAHEYCGGKWIAVGGGGYDIWRVVPRAWSQIWSVMKQNKVLQGNIPDSWNDQWQDKSPVPLPETWDDDNELLPNIPRRKIITKNNKRMLELMLKPVQK